MKTKVSLSLAKDIVNQLDQEAAQEGLARSQMAERILAIYVQMSARKKRELKLDEDTRAYYASLSPKERKEDRGYAAAAGRAARRLKAD